MEKRNIEIMTNDLITYFKNNKITNPSANFKNEILVIDKKIFSYSVIIDFILLGLSIFLIFVINDVEYAILIIIGIITILYTLLIEFESINYLEINFSEKKIIIIPKNIINKRKIILFSEIVYIEVNSKFYQSQFRRYRIKMKTDNNNILLTDFNSEKNALYFLAYLQKSIK